MNTLPISSFPQVPGSTSPLRGAVPSMPAPGAAAPPQVSMLPHAAIDSEGGVRDDLPFHARSLARRMPPPARQAAPPQRQGGRNRGVADGDTRAGSAAPRGNAGSAYQQAVEQTLEMLDRDSSHAGRHDVQSALDAHYQTLEQWRVLSDALAGIEGRPLAPQKKTALREAVGELLGGLVGRDQALRKALQQHGVGDAHEAQADGQDTRPLHELRFQITGKGSFVKPLTPLATLKSIISHLGPENCEQAIAAMRAHMLSGL